MTTNVLQSALAPAGIQADRIADLWWLMFWVTGLVYLAVLVALGLAVVRGRSTTAARPSDRWMARVVATAAGLSLAVLLALLVATVVTGERLSSLSAAPMPVTVTITGHQWWWEVEYDADDPTLRAVTANELHIPIGRPVHLKLGSADVIHSFWVPSLHGKRDLVPGHATELTLQADRPGVYRGQCAEFCGLQHAQMALLVTAESHAAFDAWLHAQRQSAAGPSTPTEARGLAIVEEGSCGLCHTVQGTRAGGRLGPDLTHVAGRGTLAAGALPNTAGHREAWIARPDRLKPGVRMPPIHLSPDGLQAVGAYLETLR